MFNDKFTSLRKQIFYFWSFHLVYSRLIARSRLNASDMWNKFSEFGKERSLIWNVFLVVELFMATNLHTNYHHAFNSDFLKLLLCTMSHATWKIWKRISKTRHTTPLNIYLLCIIHCMKNDTIHIEQSLLRCWNSLSKWGSSSPFMDSECSLPCSQEFSPSSSSPSYLGQDPTARKNLHTD
jgi:hypothetical protein